MSGTGAIQWPLSLRLLEPTKRGKMTPKRSLTALLLLGVTVPWLIQVVLFVFDSLS